MGGGAAIAHIIDPPSDYIFSLKSLVDHYKAKQKKAFAAFIDLRKAFDTVWREGLYSYTN
jgi:hypothetical protein